MNTLTRLIPLTLIWTLASCATQSGDQLDPLAEMVGKNIEVAKTELGRPNKVFDMQDGTLEYIWSEATGGGLSSGGLWAFKWLQANQNPAIEC